MSYDVVISNSKLNSYKTRVITAGIDTTQYKRNPLLLWMHTRATKGTSDDVLPLGTVDNLRVDGDQLLGTLKFDESDPFAARIKAKWDAGVLKMVSPGLDIVEQTDDKSLLLPGQLRMTVSKSILREISVVDLGSNDDALALYSDGKKLNLTAGESGEILKSIHQSLNMKTIALKLGLPETATENEVLQLIGTLQDNAVKLAALETEMADLKKASIEAVVDQAIKLKRITADKRAHFITLGETSGSKVLSDTLELMTPAVKPSDFVGGNGKPGANEYKKLSEVPAEKRMELRDSNRETYNALYKAEYGIDPVY
ncbi:MAG: hypothetical protein RBR40_08325 [Tenuifilaceae bacterium]|nr:hypothetical protein [Tenuifilaceae bacterium]